MAKLTVADGFSFSPEVFPQEFVNFNGNYATVKAEDDLWRVSFNSNGEVFLRGEDFRYDKMESPSEIGDDIIKRGDVSSFSFNAPGEVGDAGQAFARIRGIEGLSGEQVHAAIETGNPEAAFGILRTVFQHDDVLKGADGHDTLVGFAGDDKIEGNGHGDQLYGGHGADRLDGGGGADYLYGGSGKDNLYGGGDDSGDGKSDVFAFANGDSGRNADHADRIHQFVSGTDSVDLGQTGADDSMLHIDHHDGNSYITLDAHEDADKMVIVVVGNDDVHKSDVTFPLM